MRSSSSMAVFGGFIFLMYKNSFEPSMVPRKTIGNVPASGARGLSARDGRLNARGAGCRDSWDWG